MRWALNARAPVRRLGSWLRIGGASERARWLRRGRGRRRLLNDLIRRPGAQLRVAVLVVFCACAAHDPRTYLDAELGFLRAGVDLEREEAEVQRVLGQRGLRVIARRETPWFVALGAQTRDAQQSAVRVISRRGVVVAEDAALDDLFAPGRVALLDDFGGSWGEYVFVADVRIVAGRDLGCATLRRLSPDGTTVTAVLDVGALGSRACVAKLALGQAGHLRATVIWPGLYAIRTPELEVELALVEPPLGQAPPPIPVLKLVEQGDWLEAARARLAAPALANAPFSERHAIGVARAAFALLAGQNTASQLAAYRTAIAYVRPGSPEAEVVADTLAHVERGWLDPDSAAALAASADQESAQPGATRAVESPALDETVIEPAPRSATVPPSSAPARTTVHQPGTVSEPSH